MTTSPNAASTSCSDNHSVSVRFLSREINLSFCSSALAGLEPWLLFNWPCTTRSRLSVCGCLVLAYKSKALPISPVPSTVCERASNTYRNARPKANASSRASDPPAANAPPWACAASPTSVTLDPKTHVGIASPAKFGYRFVYGVASVRALTRGFQFCFVVRNGIRFVICRVIPCISLVGISRLPFDPRRCYLRLLLRSGGRCMRRRLCIGPFLDCVSICHGILNRTSYQVERQRSYPLVPTTQLLTISPELHHWDLTEKPTQCNESSGKSGIFPTTNDASKVDLIKTFPVNRSL